MPHLWGTEEGMARKAQGIPGGSRGALLAAQEGRKLCSAAPAKTTPRVTPRWPVRVPSPAGWIFIPKYQPQNKHREAVMPSGDAQGTRLRAQPLARGCSAPTHAASSPVGAEPRQHLHPCAPKPNPAQAMARGQPPATPHFTAGTGLAPEHLQSHGLPFSLAYFLFLFSY